MRSHHLTDRFCTLRTANGRCVLQFERRLPHPVEKVWRAISDPEELKHWFPAEIKADFRVGGELFWVWGGDEPDTPGVITEFDPPRRWAHEADDETIRFELYPDGDGCRLVFTHIFDDRAGAAGYATGWHGCVDALGLVLRGETPSWEAMGELRKQRTEAYFEAFGLLEGHVDQSPEGPVVRFERQFTEPVDLVWQLLTAAEGADPLAGGEPPLGTRNEYVAYGTVTRFEPEHAVTTKWGTTGKLLEYAWQVDGENVGHVRWVLSAGPGGARVVLTQSVPAGLESHVPTALAAWHTQLEVVAYGLKGGSQSWPHARTDELRRRYAAA